MDNVDPILLEVGREAMKLHSGMNSAHEAFAVLLEEVEEFKEEVFKKQQNRSDDKMRAELIQVAAMAIRAIADLNLQRSPLREVAEKMKAGS